MPVIDHTKHTLEIERFKKEFFEKLDDVLKRLDVLEGKPKGK